MQFLSYIYQYMNEFANELTSKTVMFDDDSSLAKTVSHSSEYLYVEKMYYSSH